MNIFYILLIVLFAVNLVLFFYLLQYVKRRTSKADILKEHRKEVNNWISEINGSISEINGVTDRNLLLVEEKIIELKKIIEEADKRLSVYVKELEKSKTGEAVYTNLGKGIRAALNTENDVIQISDSFKNFKAPQPAVKPPEETPVKQQENAPVQKPPSKRQIRSFIDILANEGVPPEEIAARLDISIAEVNLAMNLRRKN